MRLWVPRWVPRWAQGGAGVPREEVLERSRRWSGPGVCFRGRQGRSAGDDAEGGDGDPDGVRPASAAWARRHWSKRSEILRS